MKREIPYPVNALMSFHYFEDYDLDRLPNLNIIGDSGAFSAKTQGATITLEALSAWGRKWSHRLAWVAALDVIGDPDRTYRNWYEMVNRQGVKAVPTIHFGTEPAELDRYADEGVDFVGLGGLVGVPTKRQMRWLIQVFKYARANHPGMRFHGWGCTSIPHYDLPFYSVDSTSWTGSVRYGTMVLADPRTGKNVTYKLDGREAFQPRVARLLTDYYGISPRDASYSNAANRPTIVRLASLSMAVKEVRFRKRHGLVTAPTWITGQDGPHLHLAEGSATNLGDLNAVAGPHLHLAESDQKGLLELDRNANGPHLHLATAYGNADPQQLENLATSCTNLNDLNRQPADVVE